MKIRKAHKEDLKKIDEIFREEYSKFPYNEKWPKKKSLAKLREYLKYNSIFVIENSKEIIGFIIGHIKIWDKGDEGFIDEIAVSKKFQGKGYGRLLMNFIINYFDRKNCKSLGLMNNPKSIAFKIYKRRGFNKSENLIYMTKKLK
jgi:ribosomal protein S18 acetylase RimI-like enzyme